MKECLILKNLFLLETTFISLGLVSFFCLDGRSEEKQYYCWFLLIGEELQVRTSGNNLDLDILSECKKERK